MDKKISPRKTNMRNDKKQETKEKDEQKYQVYYTTQEKHQEFRTEPNPRKL